jgi:hypothetical protein
MLVYGCLRVDRAHFFLTFAGRIQNKRVVFAHTTGGSQVDLIRAGALKRCNYGVCGSLRLRSGALDINCWPLAIAV